MLDDRSTGPRSVCVLLVVLAASLAVSAAPPVRLRSGAVGGPEDGAGLPPALRADRARLAADGGTVLVRLGAPFGPQTAHRLRGLGARVEALLDPGAAIVSVPAGRLADLERLVAPEGFVAPYHPGLRADPVLFDPAVPVPAGAGVPLTAHLLAGADVEARAAELAAAGGLVTAVAGGRPPRGAGTPVPARIVFLAARGRLAALRDLVIRWPDTLWLGPRPVWRLLNDDSAWVGQAGLDRPQETPVFDRGIRGEGQVVGVLDTGLDADMCYFRDDANGPPPTVQGLGAGSPDPAQRKVLIVDFLWDQESPSDPTDWDTQDHGTHVAGSIAGDDPATPGRRDHGDGMAPAARLVIQDGGYGVDDCADLPAIGCPAASLYPFFEQAFAQGARIHSNSYGDRENFTPYNIYSDGSADADRFMRDHPDFLLVFAAGNNGPGAATVASPATAKNVLAVGATGHGASAGSVASFSSWGPTHDGRIKPDVMAPGSGVISADNDGDVGTNNCSTRSMSGTSMACPTAAGLAALARQYFTDGFWPSGTAVPADGFTPSAALVKATLIASAAPMENVATPPPSDEQGWGRIQLDDALYFPDDARRLFVADERTGFASAGDPPWETTLQVIDGALPLRVVLAWTDEASTPAASVNLVNDLDLEAVSPSGTVYRGNVFDAGASVPGGTPDRVNNVEVLRVENPESGTWTVRVRPFAVPAPPQDFALVVTGRLPAPGIVLERTSLAVDDSVGGDGDGILEPGEWVDLPLTLLDSGDTPATGVRVRVETASPHVDVVQAVAPGPDLAPGESAPVGPPQLRVRLHLDYPCTEPLALTFFYEADGYQRSEPTTLPTGSEAVFLVDDLEGATGWHHVAAESTASTGDWIVDDPNGTEAQPEDDVTPDPGVRCLFTAQNTSLGTDDVDDGVVVARSGAYDLSGHPEARLRIWRWFANRDRGEDPGDFFRLEIRQDSASPDVLLEELDSRQDAPSWQPRTFRVADFVTPGAAIELKVSAADGTADGNIIEAAIDEIAFWDPACDTWNPPPAPVDTLRAERAGDDVVLRWQRPAPEPQRGEASAYRVYRSEQADGGFGERDLVEDTAAEVTWPDPGAAAAPQRFLAWLVVAENASGASEPPPP
ncbi:MAG: hypothetical protein Kow0062_26320 [Acidobacteriota bacterium]